MASSMLRLAKVTNTTLLDDILTVCYILIMDKQATYLEANGMSSIIEPANGTDFTLKEMQECVGGTIDLVKLTDDMILVINDNGKLDGLKMNEQATKRFKEAYPIEEYPHNNDELIVGDVIYCHRSMVK